MGTWRWSSGNHHGDRRGLGCLCANNNEVIDRDEALAAVAAYLQRVISKEEVLADIKLYFAS